VNFHGGRAAIRLAGIAQSSIYVDRAAQDIARDAFAQLFVHWQNVSKYKRPEAWMRRVAIRLAVRTTRASSRIGAWSGGLVASEQTAAS
jgi:DNA-directed RNA polymerase specialized sigma24 family protein